MYDKIKHLVEENLVEQWRDTRLWGLIVFGIVVVLASWSGVRVIETNYELQKKISQLGQQNQVYDLQNQNQKLENQYFETDTYLELSARRQFSKAEPGESLVLVPKDVAYKAAPEVATVSVPKTNTGTGDDSKSPGYLRNAHAWRDFILGHTLR